MISREEAIHYLEFIRRRANKLFVNAKEFKSAINKAKSDMHKLDRYETKLTATYGECDTLLDVVVDGLVKQAEEHKIGHPRKARLLTDEDVDLWEQSKCDRQKLEKIEQTLKDCDKGKFDKFYCFCRIEQIVKRED